MSTPSVLDHIREAAYLNSQGVNALTMDDPRAVAPATAAFRRSLRILQSLSDLAGPPGVPPTQHPTIPGYGRVPMPSYGSFYIHDEVKLFYPSSDEAVARSQLPVYSVVVIFNTALAYHRRAMETKMTKFFDAALRLYESAIQLCALHTGNNQDMLVLYIAMVNNVSLIQNELANLGALQGTMSTLRKVLHDVMGRNVVRSAVDLDILNQVQLNALTVNLSAPASAA